MKDSNLSLYGTKEVYLDSNATTQPLPEVVELVASAMASGCGNPSSVHAAGERSRALLRKAREQVASFVNTADVNTAYEDRRFAPGGRIHNGSRFAALLKHDCSVAEDGRTCSVLFPKRS